MTNPSPHDRLTAFLQEEMKRRGVDDVPAVEAARWLDRAGLLRDSESRPGLPLRERLRRGEIGGGEHRPPRPHGRWYVVRLDRARHRPGSRIEEGLSTVYVFGELEPRELAFFNADEIRVDPRHRLGATVEVIGHGVGFWSPDNSTARAFATYLEGEALLRLTVAAYSLLGGTPFRVRANGWVEARDVVGEATMMGFSSPRFGYVKLWDHDDSRNAAIREAVAIAAKARRWPLYRLALRDLHAAALEPGDDAFVYAYRAVEAVRQAITPIGSEKAQWAPMHQELGTREVDYRKLAAVSAVVRHPRPGSDELRKARRPRRRRWLLGLAREAVVLAFERRLGRRLIRIGAA
jgi:hypothetical protein